MLCDPFLRERKRSHKLALSPSRFVFVQQQHSQQAMQPSLFIKRFKKLWSLTSLLASEPRPHRLMARFVRNGSQLSNYKTRVDTVTAAGIVNLNLFAIC